MKRNCFLAQIILALSIISCTKDNTHVTDKEYKALDLSEEAKSLVQGNKSFANKLLLGTLLKYGESSFMVSPLSCTINLSMLLESIDEDEENVYKLYEMIGFDGAEHETIRDFCHTMMFDLPQLSNTTTFSMSNLIIADSGKGPVRAGYQDIAEKYYSAIVSSQPFVHPDEIVKFVNDWAGKSTLGLINSIIDEFDVKKSDAFLANAVYFKGLWSYAFDVDNTARQVFNLENGGTASVMMMHNSSPQFARCTQKTAYSRVSIPYGNKAFSMNIYLPNQGYGVKDVAKFLANGDDEKGVTVNVSSLKIPKFSVKSKYDLLPVLDDLCAEALSGSSFMIRDAQASRIGSIKHPTSIIVDESGTEAAAISLTDMYSSSGPGLSSIEFCADRPFIFSISESFTGIVVFMGVYYGD